MPGEPISGPASPTFIDGNPCTLDVPNKIDDGQAFDIRAEGVGAGGQGALIASGEPAFRSFLIGPEPAPFFERPLLVRFPAQGAIMFDAVASDGQGSVTYSFGPQPPPPGEDALIFWTQILCSDSTGAMRLCART